MTILVISLCDSYWVVDQCALCPGRYTKGVDMWSLGCIVAEMLLERPLFPGTSTINQIERIMATLDAPSPQDVASVCSGSVLGGQVTRAGQVTRVRSGHPGQVRSPGQVTGVGQQVRLLRQVLRVRSLVQLAGSAVRPPGQFIRLDLCEPPSSPAISLSGRVR